MFGNLSYSSSTNKLAKTLLAIPSLKNLILGKEPYWPAQSMKIKFIASAVSASVLKLSKKSSCNDFFNNSDPNHFGPFVMICYLILMYMIFTNGIHAACFPHKIP